MVATQSGLHKAHDSPKGLQMDRLMDVWTDEDGGAHMKWLKKKKKISVILKKKKKRHVFTSDCISPAMNSYFFSPPFCVYFVPDQYARGGLWKPDDAETQLIH